eukprot:TRINITY_DN120411_c2_g1_i1.p1 TRINITY_DN120411_c2_g1~~TRINITY_DN120411_c2_g1_i1.p1  ORF type:complete len:267 (+),score=36.16 TRINITY_DN120411_c2_g1_i1:25-825(+)
MMHVQLMNKVHLYNKCMANLILYKKREITSRGLMEDNALNAFLKKRIAETGPTELDPRAARATKGASVSLSCQLAQKASAADGKDDVWAVQAAADVLPTDKKVVDVSYFCSGQLFRIIKQKKKAEEDQKMFAESSSPSSSPVKEEAKKKAGSKEIRFDMPKGFTNTTNQAKEFPSLNEAANVKSSPAKIPDKKPAPAEKPAEAPQMELPRFTNTKKKDDKPVFAKLEEQKELTHKAELLSTPYTAENPREFKVRIHTLILKIGRWR